MEASRARPLLKLEIEQLTRAEATEVAAFLGGVVGKAHARQTDAPTAAAWRAELRKGRSKTLDAPGWLWSSIVDLVASHEAGYLHHCRRYALREAAQPRRREGLGPPLEPSRGSPTVPTATPRWRPARP